jgi:hypothetical protein
MRMSLTKRMNWKKFIIREWERTHKDAGYARVTGPLTSASEVVGVFNTLNEAQDAFVLGDPTDILVDLSRMEIE